MVLKTTAQRKFQLFEMDVFYLYLSRHHSSALKPGFTAKARRARRSCAGEKITAQSSRTVILSIPPAAFHLSLFPFAPLAS